MDIQDSQRKTETIAVIGLGYVGLPLSVMLGEKGFYVTGIDLDTNRVMKLQQGRSYIGDIDDTTLKKVTDSGHFHATTNFDAIKAVDAIIICVPTPLTQHKTPDVSFIMSAGMEISARLQKGQLVILESSTFPGTSKEVLLPILKKGGLKVGTDFFLANSPERIDPGNKNFRVDEIPKVIGGVTEQCRDKALALYQKIYREVVPVSSTEAAELTKLLENTFRFVNISFINEMAMLCDQLKVDIWEVISAAATKPYGFTPFYPGPGIGGHCIPVDPIYLQWKLQQYETSSAFITISDQINTKMIDYIVTRTEELLKPTQTLSSAKILIYGITYKKDVADIRDSPTLEIMKQFIQKGATVSYHDPYIPQLTILEHSMTSVALTENLLSEMDCVIILTDHSSIPLDKILHHAQLVFDTRNVTKGHQGTAHVVRLGEGDNL
ncbi:nucleotide sugar dehydrogenase [Neobacillus sp. OS1-32]|uniref:Nucleotide sugar dehydrogenase n=1 Tax=Neobacillus paridis TaxID=2803862 RepID=A0ABS1TTH0_9BACI|nr:MULTISPECIES: nucleotide sugar dehydrogenase [Neobacillus]MBL4954595.1 nucleotide sugar dehydrogenase [Neobacillus paridis]WML29390.1 nucleotide sugar dehydrogenase [Neobacillus sp. OS1-32]